MATKKSEKQKKSEKTTGSNGADNSVDKPKEYRPHKMQKWQKWVAFLMLPTFKAALVAESFLPDEWSVMGFWSKTVLFVLSLFVSIFLTFLRFTFVKESSAQAIMRFSSFHRMVYSKKDHMLDEEYDLQQEKDYKYRLRIPFTNFHIPWERFLGGLRPYIWILEKIHMYDWEWIKSHPDGTLENKKEKNVDHILIGQDYTFGMIITGNDAVDINGVPVELTLALTVRIVNPRKALFEAKHWFDVFMARIEPPIRAYVNGHSYEEMLADRAKKKDGGDKDKKDGNALRLDDKIYADLKEPNNGNDDIIVDLEKKYGVRVVAVQCRRFSLREDYQKIITDRWEGEQEAQKRTANTMGAIVSMMAKATGKSESEIQARFEKDEKVRETLLQMSKDLVEQQLAANAEGANALRRYYFSGAGGGMDLVALLTDALGRNNGGASSNGKNSTDAGDKTVASSKKKDASESTLSDEDDDDDDEDED